MRDWTPGMLAVFGLAFLLLILMGYYPGRNARRRRHPRATAINVGGWLWLVAVLIVYSTAPTATMIAMMVWLALVVWSYAGPTPVGDISSIEDPHMARPSARPRAKNLSYRDPAAAQPLNNPVPEQLEDEIEAALKGDAERSRSGSRR